MCVHSYIFTGPISFSLNGIAYQCQCSFVATARIQHSLLCLDVALKNSPSFLFHHYFSHSYVCMVCVFAHSKIKGFCVHSFLFVFFLLVFTQKSIYKNTSSISSIYKSSRAKILMIPIQI